MTGGALALAVNLSDSSAFRFAGLLAALWGTLLVMLVLLTGGRGRRKASVGISVGLATVMAFLSAGLIEAVYVGLDSMESMPTVAARPPPPRLEPTPPVDVEPQPEDEDAAAFLAEEEEEVAPRRRSPARVVAAAAPAAAPRPAPAPGTQRPAQPPPAARPAPAPTRTERPAPPPEPAPATTVSSAPKRTLQTSVVETMVRNNKNIKRCFYNYKQETGSLPSRVDVRFTVENAGSVSSARVTTDQYKGTDFDVCLGSAFRSISFPPFDGDAQTLTYPFVL